MNLLLSFSEILNYAYYVCLALLVLLVMITFHEFGHYIVGKIFKFGIEEFSIGFGPKLYSKKKNNGEIFSIRLLPLGGFCAFKGEDGVDENGNAYSKDDADVFSNKKPWQRILVLIAGAFMNYLLAIIIIMATFGIYGQSFYKVNKINEDVENQVFQVDDVILAVNDKNVYLVTDLINSLDGKKSGDKIKVTILRNNLEQDIFLSLYDDANFENLEDTGVILSTLGLKTLEATQVKFGFFKTISKSFAYSGKIATTIFNVIHQLFNGQLGIKSMGGTITTIAVTTNAIKVGGLYNLLSIASLIGVNLALFNLLPIPALDGSRVVFCLIEWIIGKPVNRKVESIIHGIGFVVLLLFAIFVDVQQLF